MKRNYDSTVARIAGNILSGSGVGRDDVPYFEDQARRAVMLARMVVAEVERTEPTFPLTTPAKGYRED